jgi:hypothetical protein
MGFRCSGQLGGGYLYAAHNQVSDGGANSVVTVIDITYATTIATVPVNDVAALAISPDGSRVYAVSSDRHTYYRYPAGWLTVIDRASIIRFGGYGRTLEHAITAPGLPFGQSTGSERTIAAVGQGIWRTCNPIDIGLTTRPPRHHSLACSNRRSRSVLSTVHAGGCRMAAQALATSLT